MIGWYTQYFCCLILLTSYFGSFWAFKGHTCLFILTSIWTSFLLWLLLFFFFAYNFLLIYLCHQLHLLLFPSSSPCNVTVFVLLLYGPVCSMIKDRCLSWLWSFFTNSLLILLVPFLVELMSILYWSTLLNDLSLGFNWFMMRPLLFSQMIPILISSFPSFVHFLLVSLSLMFYCVFFFFFLFEEISCSFFFLNFAKRISLFTCLSSL